MIGTIKFPQHLLERIRLHLPGVEGNAVDSIEDFPAAAFASGRPVIYWTRSALRVDENPALDVARSIACQLKLPLLVYQGLSQRYAFASDRHHTFILQGARQLQCDLQALNIAYAFYLETPATRRKVLVELANQAACIITEEMPVDPPRYFLDRLQQQSKVPVFTVDTSCVLPMQLIGRSFTRAFQFREATTEQFRQRTSKSWPECQESPSAYDLRDLHFEPLDWSQCTIQDWVAECDIDHTVGPVVDTVGGSLEGYNRWQSFLSSGLQAYHHRRNSAEVDGVSRMSAYLHYGMVSPFRIAREAAMQGGKGAEKFLDELLIWRELAYNFCFYRKDHDSWSAIPSWAQQTLLQHQSDVRPQIYDWETLARGQTGDSLWNAAQQSLLRHGELHNNLRMTWGKKLLDWVKDPQAALQLIFDLNHRYALDGRDPCSFAGILWCLGQFDRAFEPEQAVFGLVRPRSTSEHAKRLNVATYRANRVTHRYASPPKIAIIGAGISGLVAARTLKDHGLEVDLFEKSRGVSGRVATRRTDSFQYDHGAQYFTARHPVFRRYVDSWVEQGWVKPWACGSDTSLVAVDAAAVDVSAVSSGSLSSNVEAVDSSAEGLSCQDAIVVIKRNQRPIPAATQRRYVACPGMNEIGKRLAKDLEVRSNTQIAAVKRSGKQLVLVDLENNNLGIYDKVICTAPAYQAASLLAEFPELAAEVAKVELLPCWALMVTFDQPLSIDWAGAFVHDSPIAWIGRESSKPGRIQRSAFVIHANSAWSTAHLESQPDEVAGLLLEDFFSCTGCSKVTPLHWMAHRWRYSIARNPLNSGCLFDQTGSVYACGDWVMGSRIEGAFLSGIAAAGRILGQLQPAAGPVVPTQLTLFDASL
jgi:photolyase PhrII